MEEVYTDRATIRAVDHQAFERRKNAGYTLFVYLRNSEDVFGRVRSIIENRKGERRDGPALDRLLARDWRNVEESEAALLRRIGGKVSVPEIPGSAPAQETVGG